MAFKCYGGRVVSSLLLVVKDESPGEVRNDISLHGDRYEPRKVGEKKKTARKKKQDLQERHQKKHVKQ